VTAIAPGVAFVSGGSRGIGRAIAVELAMQGHTVAINYVAREDQADETLAQVEAAGSKGICVQGDVSKPTEVNRCFDEVEAALGPVTTLVNNAGVRRDGLAISMPDDAWDQVIATSLSGTFYCSRRALRPMLKARSGRIVNITSVAGLRASAGQTNYSAAKAGVIGLTKSLAREVAAKGITVNAVAPGLIETELTTDLGPDRFAAITAAIPAKRPGQPQDVAALVGWLCSESASYVTGSVFTTDGGMSA
jgi:3-oxoacyl-[acyl-carrier protein] reductase